MSPDHPDSGEAIVPVETDDPELLKSILRVHRAGIALIGTLLTGALDDPAAVLVSIERVVGGIEGFERSARSAARDVAAGR